MRQFLGKIFILLAFANQALALVPLEGLIYGDVKDIKQFDPLQGVFSSSTMIDPNLLNDYERKKIEEYIGLYRDGANLINICEKDHQVQYMNNWLETTAKRTVVSTLQYIGIDLSMRAIIEYMKLLEYTEEQFDNVAKNLVENHCSKNITVYSLQLIRDNFKYLYQSGTNYTIPSISKSPYFTEAIRQTTNSRQAKQNELNLTLKNFRAFCSWGGDPDDYRLLVPYINNPYIMSYVFNHLMSRQVSWDDQQKAIVHQTNEKSVKVGCEDLICRKTDKVQFLKKFPRMIGSTELSDDFRNLYCGHFQKANYNFQDTPDKIKQWLKKQTLEEPILEAMNFVALISGVPDLLIASQKYNEMLGHLRENIDSRFKKWATDKTDQFVVDMLYEESLNVDLIPMAKSEEVIKGQFQMIFDFTLGELDRVISTRDKISSKFHLDFPKSYLRWIRDDYVKKNNKSDYKGLKLIEDRLTTYINIQLSAKSKLFLVPLWNDQMGRIIAKELIDQLSNYKGTYFVDFSHTKVQIPVKFRYGLFALKYINDKFKASYRQEALTYNK